MAPGSGWGAHKPLGFPLSFGSCRPGSHLLPSAAPNWAETALRGHLQPPSVLTTWELGLWSLRDPFTPSRPSGIRAWCQSRALEALSGVMSFGAAGGGVR